MPIHPQDRFIKYKKKTYTKNDKTLSDVAWGWYNKDDMSKVLKWSTNLSTHQGEFIVR